MIEKHLILTKRVRSVPKSFGWVDHRLVRDRHMERCSHAEAALYLFLVCVSDHQGLSYYGDKSLMAHLSMEPATLEGSRSGLIQKGLIAWRQPIYQVLSLEPTRGMNTGSMASLSDLLKAATGGAA